MNKEKHIVNDTMGDLDLLDDKNDRLALLPWPVYLDANLAVGYWIASAWVSYCAYHQCQSFHFWMLNFPF